MGLKANNKMTNDDLIKIGFEIFPQITLGKSVIYNLKRRRILFASGVGTPNEIIYLCELDSDMSSQIVDSICIYNYDYDGSLTIEKVQLLITALTGRVF